MKNIITSAALLICLLGKSISMLAQPVLTNTMSPFPVGTTDSIFGASATVAPGSGGAGVTWNISALSPTYEGQIGVVDVSTSPYYSTFPTSTFCAEITPTVGSPMYVYERISSSRWEQLANNYAGTGTGTVYTNPESSLDFPMSYLDSFVDTFQKTTGGPNTVTVTYDGYGTLITPFATYTNVVRIQKYWGVGDYDYNWYITSPYLDIIASYDAQSSAYTIIGSNIGSTAIKEVNAKENVSVYPNPFTGSTTLKVGVSNFCNASFTMTDAIGRVVKQMPVTANETTISRDGLCAGLYFYSVQNNGVKITTGKLIIQ